MRRAMATRSGRQDGILTKNIAPIAAPVPHAYFKRHQRFVPSP